MTDTEVTMFPIEFIKTTTGPKKGTVNLKGSGLHNANTKGGSLNISKPNSGPAKVLPKR